MTAAAPPAVSDRAGLAAPLVLLAPFARRLMLLAMILVVAASVVMAVGEGTLAMTVAAIGGSLAVMAGIAALVGGYQAQKITLDARAVARVLADDPDPVVVSDHGGTCRAVNGAARAVTELDSQLNDWCVTPAATIAAMLDEVSEFGRSERNYKRKNKSLRVVSHEVSGVGGAIVWRFSERDLIRDRSVEDLGVPIVTLDDSKPSANRAARALGDLSDIIASVQRGARRFNASSVPLTAKIPLPDGQVADATFLNGFDGLQDVVLLPETRQEGTLGPVSMTDFEEIPVALVQLDAQGRIVVTNRLARSLLSLDRQETRYFWQVVEGLGRPVADWLEDAQAGRALGRPEVLRASLTGAESYVQIILRRSGDASGSTGLVAVISDATELKSLEARFVQSQKMQAIGQLAGGIAHDFNNLLTAISGHCDLLLINRDRYDPDYNDLLQIHQNANRAAALVRQLLAFSRKQTMKSEVFRLESLLEELTHLLTRLVGERITLTLSHDPALAAIRADRRQLEQVIMNLVVNARDAMPMGGTIRIETQARTFATEQEHGRARVPPGKYALIRVIDEGVGISANIIDKIFEPFFTTKKLGEGTGLGLSTAYGIVKQMGGYIFAQSVEGSGTTFTLYFAALDAQELDVAEKGTWPAGSRGHSSNIQDDPKVGFKHLTVNADSPDAPTDREPLTDTEAPEKPDVTPPPTRTAPVPKASNGGAILLVEDEAPVRAFAARALRLQGYTVFEAQDGEQALDFLKDRAHRIDLFVTDVIMPGIDGPGWVAQALTQRPGTPVVFVSGYTEDTLSAALSRIPRAVFLGKPFSLKDLSETISAQIAG